MKNQTRIIFLLTYFLLTIAFAHAQTANPTAGGDVTGANGSSSYTIGQVVYTTIISDKGSSAQGVQHPYKVDIISGINEPTIQLEISAYPNPTTHWMNIQVKNLNNRQLAFQLFDITGKLIKQSIITQVNTAIPMQNLAAATYLLSVSEKNKVVKTFKIIKTN